MKKSLIALALALCMLFAVLPVYGLHWEYAVPADYTGSYYSDNGYSVETLLSESGSALFNDLNTLMTQTHTHVTSYNEIRNMFVGSDADPDTAGNIILFYSGASVNGAWDSGATYSREHVWPASLGTFSNNNAGADLYHIRPENQTVNGGRNNYPMAWVDTADTELQYDGSGIHCYVGTSDGAKVFEPRDEVKGDVARIYFYIAARWEEDLTAPVYDDTFKTLLEWNILDPVDAFEAARLEYVYSVQGDRNVFIDYPEFGRLIYGDSANGFDYTPVTEGDYTYYISGGAATVLSYNGSAAEVEIPSALGGYPVTAIGCAAFANNSALTCVTIPAAVSNIGSYAFYNDPALTSVYVGAGAKTFERRAFRNCPALTGVYFAGEAPVFLDEGADQIMISGSDDGAIPTGLRLYYVEGQSGWTSGSWNSGTVDYPTSVWYGSSIPAAPVYISLGSAAAEPGDQVRIPLTVSGEYEAHSIGVRLSYNSEYVSIDSVTRGELVGEGMIFTPASAGEGVYSIGVACPNDPVSGSGVLAYIDITISASCTEDQQIGLMVNEFIYLPAGTTEGEAISNIPSGGVITVSVPGPEPTATPEPTAPPETGSYVLVTSAEDVTTGDYVLYGVNGDYSGAMSSSINKGHMLASAVTISGNTVVSPDPSVVWHMTKQSDGTFTLYNEASAQYCMISNDSTGGFSVGSEPTYGYTVTAADESAGIYYMQTTLTDCTRMISIYQNDFRPYNTANWHDLYLYKKVEGETPALTHTVTFVDWDGTVLKTETVEEGASATAPADPARIGYTFTGWDADFTNVTGDLTVTAQYTINSYTLTIKYVDENGVALASDYVGTFAYGETYSVTSPVIDGYTTSQT
ncbi:MAG: endonuclease, partial [Clostridia bacterium]|nr:endonuclease [Clostridia bacterium]